MDIVKFTKKLMLIPSPSGQEREIGEFLIKRLESNFKVVRQKVGKRLNILATRGLPKLLLTTHMDTVPGSPEVKESDGYLYGRGACDAKGIIAAMVFASEEAISQGADDFGLLFDVDEEREFLGVRAAIGLVKPKMIVVGEPTNLKMAVNQKGLIGLELKYYGKSASGATPEAGISAIDKLINSLHKLQGARLPENRFLGKTTVNVGKISGGTAANMVADFAQASIEVRTTVPNAEAIKAMNRLFKGKNMDIKYSLEPVVSKKQTVFDKKASNRIILPYFSEMYFWSIVSGIRDVAVFGPGKYEYAHSDKERISKTDLEMGKEAYLRLILKFSGR